MMGKPRNLDVEMVARTGIRGPLSPLASGPVPDLCAHSLGEGGRKIEIAAE